MQLQETMKEIKAGSIEVAHGNSMIDQKFRPKN